MPNELRMTGFDELRADFDRFAESSRDETAPMLAAHAERAKNALVAAYPFVTGALRAGVQLIPRITRGIATAITLRSGSDHAHFYEFGTVHEAPHPTFLPISGEHRRAATTEVVAYMKAQGLQISGDRD